MNYSDIPIWVTIVVTAIGVAATVAIACLTYTTSKAYDKQIQVSQEQMRSTFRPILCPSEELNNLVGNRNGEYFIQLQINPAVIGGLRNIGTGPAFNIYGVLFDKSTSIHRYVIWNYPSLSSGEEGKEIFLKEFTNIGRGEMIGEYTLGPQDDNKHMGIIGRLTLTYHDVFGQKCASIYDYHGRYGWKCQGHLSNILYDILELDQQNRASQRIERFHDDISHINR